MGYFATATRHIASLVLKPKRDQGWEAERQRKQLKWRWRKLGSNCGHCIIHFLHIRNSPSENVRTKVQLFLCVGLFEPWRRHWPLLCPLSFCHYGNTSLLVLGVATRAIPLPLQVFPSPLPIHLSILGGARPGILTLGLLQGRKEVDPRPHEANAKLMCVQMCLSWYKDPWFSSDSQLSQRHMSQEGAQKTS